MFEMDSCNPRTWPALLRPAIPRAAELSSMDNFYRRAHTEEAADSVFNNRATAIVIVRQWLIYTPMHHPSVNRQHVPWFL